MKNNSRSTSSPLARHKRVALLGKRFYLPPTKEVLAAVRKTSTSPALCLGCSGVVLLDSVAGEVVKLYNPSPSLRKLYSDVFSVCKFNPLFIVRSCTYCDMKNTPVLRVHELSKALNNFSAPRLSIETQVNWHMCEKEFEDVFTNLCSEGEEDYCDEDDPARGVYDEPVFEDECEDVLW